jgi:hypothetical protein
MGDTADKAISGITTVFVVLAVIAIVAVLFKPGSTLGSTITAAFTGYDQGITAAEGNG